MRSIDSKIVDLGRRCFTLQRVGDGVHFTVGAKIVFVIPLIKLSEHLFIVVQIKFKKVFRVVFWIGTRNAQSCLEIFPCLNQPG